MYVELLAAARAPTASVPSASSSAAGSSQPASEGAEGGNGTETVSTQRSWTPAEAGAGAPLPAGEGFRLLRDGEAGASLQAAAGDLQGRVLDPLAEAGVEIGALQLAWDFTVAEADEARGDMLDVVEMALPLMADLPPIVTLTSVAPVPEQPTVAFQVDGTLTAPLFLEGDGGPGSALRRDADGGVVADEEA